MLFGSGCLVDVGNPLAFLLDITGEAATSPNGHLCARHCVKLVYMSRVQYIQEVVYLHIHV